MQAPRNSAAIRRLNVVRVFHAVRETPGMSQRDLALRTGLDKATVSAVVGQLVLEGLVARTGAASAGRVGRPETGLAIAPEAGLLVGARLEPRRIRVVTATLAGTVVERVEIPGSRVVDEALVRLRDGIATALAASGADRPVRGVGIGIPGLMDRAGRLALAPNLGWKDAPMRALLEDALQAPVFVDNDAKAAALAEGLFGACREVQDFVYLAGHSGIGGGLVLGGRLFRGVSGFAGEIGHITVVPDGRPCGCGKRGCLETYVSEPAILADAAARGRRCEDVTQIVALADAGDAVVQGLLDEVGELLGGAIAQMVTLLNPSLVVLGGTLTLVAPHILPAMERALDRHAMGPLRERVRLLVSQFGPDAVPIGGIALALEGFLGAGLYDR